MNMNQLEAAARADSTARALAQGSSIPGYGYALSTDGKVKCLVIPAQKSSGWSYRATWYVDGKRVSRAWAEHCMEVVR